MPLIDAILEAPERPALSLRPETAWFISLKARAAREALGDPVRDEIASAVRALDKDERRDLLALIWLGRGDYGVRELHCARREAAELSREEAARYVADLPRSGSFLEEALLSLAGLSPGELLWS